MHKTLLHQFDKNLTRKDILDYKWGQCAGTLPTELHVHTAMCWQSEGHWFKSCPSKILLIQPQLIWNWPSQSPWIIFFLLISFHPKLLCCFTYWVEIPLDWVPPMGWYERSMGTIIIHDIGSSNVTSGNFSFFDLFLKPRQFMTIHVAQWVHALCKLHNWMSAHVNMYPLCFCHTPKKNSNNRISVATIVLLYVL